ncbi:MAG: GEVED domain-containing protein, partial [Bacteroidota bacterium]
MKKISYLFLTILFLFMANGLKAQYCTPNFTLGCDMGNMVTQFQLGSINQAITCAGSPSYYQDYTGLSTDLAEGGYYTLSVQTGNAGIWVKVWIDFDDNGIFNSPGEELTSLYCASTGITYTSSFFIPVTGYFGSHRLRFMASHNGVPTNACNDPGYGNAADFSVNIIAAVTPPTVVTSVAKAITSTSGTMQGTVTANDNPTNVEFHYGKTPAFGNVMIGNYNVVAGFTPTDIYADLTGLNPNTTYYYEIVGYGPGGYISGGTQSFTTDAVAPTVATVAATELAGTSAQLNGTVNPNNSPVHVYFDYGLTDSYGTTLDGTPSDISAQIADHDVIATLSGLAYSTTYHFRVRSVNDQFMESVGADMTFTTLATTTCIPVYSIGCSNGHGVKSYHFNTIDVTPNCDGGTGYYNDFTATPTDATMNISYPLSVKSAGSGTTVSMVWIDYDHNNVFDPSEAVGSIWCYDTTSFYNLYIHINASSNTGPTRMRVMTRWQDDFNMNPFDPCSALEINGNCSDFMLNLLPPPPPPLTITGTTDGISGTDATVHGIVNANDWDATVFINYGLTASYGSQAPGVPSPVMGNVDTPVTGSLTGLTGNTTYHYQVVSYNAGGTTYGSDSTFTTLAIAPTVTTGGATDITGYSATIHGTVNPNNQTSAVSFDYTEDPTFTTFTTVAGVPASVTGSATQDITLGLSGLTLNTSYYYRINGSNASGSSMGAPMSFKTLPTKYCIPVYGNGCSAYGLTMGLTDFVLNTISETIPCTGSPSYYHDFTATDNTDIAQNGQYSILVHAAYDDNTATVWIDYNQNNLFDPGENVGNITCGAAGNSALLFFTVPPSALLGPTTLRIMSNYYPSTGNFPTDPCSMTESWGNCSDFTVNIVAPLPLPTVTTASVSNLAGSSVDLNGIVNANGTTSYDSFDYGLTAAYGYNIIGSPNPVTGSGDSPITATVTGLAGNTTYHYRAVAINPSGTVYGADSTFLTEMMPPAATTEAATMILADGAQLNGHVNANNEPTTILFEYGLTGAYGSSVAATESPLSNNISTAVSAPLTGLAVNTIYHYRVVATNATGTTYGSDMTFNSYPTLSCIPTYNTGCATYGIGITWVGFNTINQLMSCGGNTSFPFYNNYNTPTDLNKGSSYDLQLQCGDNSLGYSVEVTAWIDYNQNNVFDHAEMVGHTYMYDNYDIFTIPITISPTATQGTSTLRIMCDNAVYPSDPCGNYWYGNCSDFTVNILPPVPPPTVTTSSPSNITGTTADVNGIINANGTSTGASFDYGLTDSYGLNIAASPNPVTGNSDTPITASLIGLAGNTTYHYRVAGTTVNGTYNGGDLTFTTNAILPAVNTLAATGITGVSANLNGNINPNNATTTARFAYGLTTSYGDTVSGTPATVNGASTQSITANITGLSLNTTYHYKALGTNVAGTQTGLDMTFTTLPTISCVPVYSTGCGTGYGLTNFTLGSISQAIPCTGSPSYYHDYTASTTTDLMPNNSYTISMSANYQNLYVTVWIDINHNNIFDVATEKVGNGYCYGNGYTMSITIPGTAVAGPARLRIMARDYYAGYPTDPCTQTEILGNCEDFTVNILPPGPPIVTTTTATTIGGTVATLNGSVNPDNLTTTVSFDYGLTDSYGSTATGPTISGGTSQNVSGNATGLTANTLYHYRVHATNSAGTTLGNDLTFNTMSATATQTVTTPVYLGQTNQQIIGITVVNPGATSYSANITSFTFNALGSTQVSDISKARLYFTSSNNYFYIGNQFGSDVTNVSVPFTFTSSYSLYPGTNYFWLVYDVSPTATPGDVLDAQCTSISCTGPFTPTVTDPAGNRQISGDKFLMTVIGTQPSTSPVTKGSLNNPSLMLDFNVVGTTGTLPLNSIDAIFTGTNATDVAPSGAKLWRNSTTDFASATLMQTQSLSGTSANFTTLGYDLPTGHTYFWVSFDIASGACGGNVIDSYIYPGYINVNGLTYPATSQDPAGNQTILPSPASLPFSESNWNQFLPCDWSKVWNYSYTWQKNYTANAGGTYPEVFTYGGYCAAGNKLITPPLDATGQPYLVLRFKEYITTNGSGTNLRIMSSSDGIAWTNEPWSFTGAAAGTYGPYNISTAINSNLGGSTYIAFTTTTPTNLGYWYVDDVQVTGPQPPTVTTTAASGINQTSATAGGNVTDDAANLVTARGVCYSTAANPTISVDPHTTDGTGTGVFVSNLSGLSAGTTYHFRAYATNGIGTSYGADLTFSTNGPNVFNVTGGGAFCTGGPGLTVGLDGSEVIANYQLYKDGVAFGSPIPGTGSPLSWNNMTEGTYTVWAITGTSTLMTGNAVITSYSNAVSVSINASNWWACSGTSRTLTANPTNPGPSPTYQWYVNNAPVGTNSPTYTYNAYGNDQVKCALTSNIGCPTGNPATGYYTFSSAIPSPSLSGYNSLCVGAANVHYSTDAGYSNYIWNVSAGATIISGGGTGNPDIYITWNSAGPQTVSVNYTNSYGCTAVSPTVLNVAVSAVPVPTITGPATACKGSTGNVYTTEPGKSSYDWTISAGGTITSGGDGYNTVTVTWNTVGPQTVSINYNDNGCPAATPTVKNVTVTDSPVPGLSGPSTACAGSTGNVYTTEASMTNYVWSVSAGGTITSGGTGADNTVTVTWNTTGSRTVSVNYTGAGGCPAASATVYNVTVNPIPAPTITGSNHICGIPTYSVTYSTEAGKSAYDWSVSAGGAITFGAGSNSITVDWTVGGAQTVSVNYATSGCAAASPTTKNVNVYALPVPTVTGNASACVGSTGNVYSTEAGMSNYVWAVSAGGIITAGGSGYNTVTVKWNTAGPQTVSASYMDANGCYAASATVKNVTVNALPVPTIGGPATACTGSTGNVYTTESGMTNYAWSVSAGGTITSGGTSGDNTVTVTWNTAGSKTVSVNYKNADGCTAAVPTVYNVTVNSTPTPTMTNGPTSVCAGSTGNLYTTQGGMTNYLWNVSAGGTITAGGTTSDNSVTVTWNTPGSESVTVTYTTPAGCSPAPGATATANVTVNADPSVTISGNNNVCQGTVVTYTAAVTNGGTNPAYHWFINGSPAPSTLCGDPSTGLVAYYPFHSNANDASNANNGTVTNATLTNDRFGQALSAYDFTGTNSYIGIPVNINYSALPQITMLAWVKPVNTSPYRPIITNDDGGFDRCLTIDDRGSSSGYSCFTGSGVLGGLPVTSGTWEQVAVTYDQAAHTANLYHNADAPLSAATSFGTGYLTSRIGNNQGSGSNFLGSIDDVRIYNRILTAAEITSLYNNTYDATFCYIPKNGDQITCQVITQAGCSANSNEIDMTVNPAPTPTLTGPASVCVNSTGNIYSTEAGKSNYAWNISAGGAITSGGTIADNTVTVTWTAAGANTVSVNYEVGGCSAASATVKNVTVNALPNPSITGSATVCGIPSSGNTYSTTAGMTGYVWNVSPGGTIDSGDGTESISVTWATTGTKTVTVTFVDGNGCSPATPASKTVSVYALPVPSISGPAQICGIPSTGNIYTTESGMSNYSWSVSAGGTINSGLGSNSIHVTWSTTGAKTVTVSYTDGNGCNSATPSSYNVNVYDFSSPTITGPATICGTPSAGNGYSTEGGMTGYSWTVSSGGVINSGLGTDAISVTWSTPGSKTVTVNYTDGNGCSAPSATSKTVNVHALPVPSLSGPTTVCDFPSTGNVYTTDPGMTGYTWVVSAGGTITSGGTSADNTVTVTWNAAGAESVSVTYIDTYGCVPATPKVSTVNIYALPVPTISGPSAICGLPSSGNVYTTEAGMSSYSWSVSPGGTINSGLGSNSIHVTWSTTGSKTVTVSYTRNGCTAAAPTSYPVTVNSFITPTLTGPATICGIPSVGNVYTTEAGMTGYTWAVSSGGLITAGGTSSDNTVTIEWNVAGNQTVSVNYTDGVGCSAASPIVKNVSVNALPVPSVTGPMTICGIPSAGNVYSTEPGMSNYVWSVPDGTITSGGTSTDNTVTVTWTTTGPKNVVVSYTTPAGCVPASPTSALIYVYLLPVATVTGPTSICGTPSTGNHYVTEAFKNNYVWALSSGGTITNGSGTNDITVTWSTPGSKTVSVTYHDANGCAPLIAASMNTVVYPYPAVTLTGPAAICGVPSAGNVYTTEAGMTDYTWAVSPPAFVTSGGTLADNFITVTWLAAGTHTVSLNYIDGNGCHLPTSLVKDVVVEAIPVPTVTGPSLICGIPSVGNTYTTEPGKAGYTWAVSAGGSITSGQGTRQIAVTWSSAGAQTVTVDYTTALGCASAGPATQNVNVFPFTPATITGPSGMCGVPSAGNVYTTAPGMSNYVWTAPGGTITAGTGTNAITVTWNSAGSKTVTVTYNDGNGCSPAVPISFPVDVYALPTPVITGNATVCDPPSASNVYSTAAGMTNYIWNVSPGGTITSGGTSSDNTVTVTWTTLGSQTVSVGYTDTHGCISASPTVKNVGVFVTMPVSVSIVVATNPNCAGINDLFTATPVNGGASPSYQWKVNGSNTGWNSPTLSYAPANGDVVTCVLTSSLPCTSGNPATSGSITMSVLPAPAAPVSGGDQSLCSTQLPATLSVTPPAGSTTDWYNWPSGGNLLSQGHDTYATSTAGTYYAESRDLATGCKSLTRTAVHLAVTQATKYYLDADGDGYGNPNIFIYSCSLVSPAGYVPNGDDCDDNNPNINPAAQHFAYTGNPGFTNSVVSPTTGSASDVFHFEVDYYDANNSLPPLGYPRVMLDYEGDGSYLGPNDRVVLMTELDPNDVTTTDGKRYICDVTNLPYGNTYKTTIVSGSIAPCKTTFGPFASPAVLHPSNIYIFANDISFSNPHPDPGTQITVSAVIHNESDYPAQNFVCHLENQFDLSIVYPDSTIANIPPHQNYTLHWIITTPLVPAWCPMKVYIDYTNVIVESNELDNTAIRPFTNGNYQVAGKIVVTSAVSPHISYTGQYSYLYVYGHAHYEDIAVPLLDPSVAGATVTSVVEETHDTIYGYTNSWGDYGIYFPSPGNPAGKYHVTTYVTDFTLTGHDTTHFHLIDPPPPVLLPNLTMFCHGLEVTPVNPDNPALGGLVNLVANVVNVGNADAVGTIAQPIEVKFTYSTGWTNTVQFVGVIPAGQTHVFTYTGAPLPISGTLLTALIDPNNWITEWSKTDNSMADNMCYEFQPVPVCGGNFWHNYCLNESSPIYVGLNVTHLYDASSVDVLFEVKVPGSAVWQTLGTGTLNNATKNCSCPYIVNCPGAPFTFSLAGTYTFRMTVDPNHVYTQCDPTNDVLIVEATAGTCAPPITKPNLTLNYCRSVTVLPINPADPINGGIVTIVAHVVNNGNAATPVGTPIDVDFTMGAAPPVRISVPGPLGIGETVNVSWTTALPLTGTELTAEVDHNNTISEWDESYTDNHATDLMCHEFEPVHSCGTDFWDRTYLVGQSTVLGVAVAVSHLYDADPVAVRFDVWTPTGIGWVPLGDAIMHNAIKNCYCPWGPSLPTPYTFFEQGVYTFRMTVDPDNVYPECNEFNNIKIVTVNVTDGADLRELSQFINPSVLNPGVGDSVSMIVSYDNIGNSDVTDQMHLHVMVDEIYLDDQVVPGLPTGDHNSILLNHKWASPIPGAHIIRAIIDYNHQVVEAHEDNNEATRAIIVGQAANPYPQIFAASKSNPDSGEYITLYSRIGNNGDVDCSATVRFFYLNHTLDTIPIGSSSIFLPKHDSVPLNMPWFVVDPHTTLILKIVNISVLEFNPDDDVATTQIGGIGLTVSSTPACPGEKNGSLTAHPTGGTEPYHYLWSNNVYTQTITGSPWTYTVTVTDNAGLTAIGSGTITTSSIPVPTLSGDSTVCGISGGHVYTTEPNMTAYSWTVSSGGSITAGGTSTSNTVTVTWNTEGAHTVTVTYSNAYGCAATTTATYDVTVYPRPVASITGPDVVCQGSTGNIYSTQPGMTGYVWNVSEGRGTITTGQGTNSIGVKWTAAGAAVVQVVYHDAHGCTPATITSFNVTVNPGQVTTLTGPASVCQNSTGNVYTTDAGMTSYLWQVSGGGSVTGGGTGTDNSVTVTWSTLGAQSVKVSYINTFGCTTPPDSLGVMVYPVPAPTISGPDTVDINTSHHFTTQEGMSVYSWTPTGGSVTAGGQTYNATILFTVPGNQTIGLNVSSHGCSASPPVPYSLFVKGVFATPTITGPSETCIHSTGNVYTTEAGMTGYTWTVSAGGSITAGGGASDNTVTVTWTTAGAQSVSVNYTDTYGHTSASPTVFDVTVYNLPSPTISGPASGCVNTAGYVYTTQAGKSGYTWTLSAGGNIESGGTSADNSITVDWGTTGPQTVSVNYSDAHGCTAASAVSYPVTVYDQPLPVVTGPATVCVGSTGNFYYTESGMSNYVWSVLGGFITPGGGITDTSVTITWTSAGSRYVLLNYTNGNGCRAADPTAYNVIVNTLPVPGLSGPTPVCLNATGNVYTTESGMTDYTWNVTGGTITSGGGSTNHTATVTWTSAGAKSVSVNYTDGNGCRGTDTVFGVTVNTLPVVSLSGPAVVCLNTTGNLYTTDPGKTNYIWSVAGGTITSGGGTSDNTATVTWTSAGSQHIDVGYTDGCGSAPKSLPVTVNVLPVPALTGPTPVCLNSTGNVYTTESGMSDYTWTIDGGTITSGGGITDHTATVTWTSSGARSISVNY